MLFVMGWILGAITGCSSHSASRDDEANGSAALAIHDEKRGNDHGKHDGVGHPSSNCPVVVSLAADPTHVLVGASTTISAVAQPTNAQLHFTASGADAGSAGSGKLSEVGPRGATFTCNAPGPVVLSAVAETPDCDCPPQAKSIVVTCDSPSNVVIGVSAGDGSVGTFHDGGVPTASGTLTVTGPLRRQVGSGGKILIDLSSSLPISEVFVDVSGQAGSAGYWDVPLASPGPVVHLLLSVGSTLPSSGFAPSIVARGINGEVSPPISVSVGVVDSTVVPPPPAPAQCVALGDPHLLTFDGRKYDCQAVGELTLARSTTDNFEVQIRTRPWRTRQDVSVISAVAARVGDNRIAFYVDGTTTLNQTPTVFGGGMTALSGGGAVYASSGGYWVVWPDTTEMQVAFGGDYIGVRLFVPRTRASGLAGLCGNFDGSGANDLVTRDGYTVLSPSPSFEQFYGTYVMSWRVASDDSDSLFDYGPAQTTKDFTDLTFPHVVASTSTLSAAERAAASTSCLAANVASSWFDSCLMDVGFTGDPYFALQFDSEPLPDGGVCPLAVCPAGQACGTASNACGNSTSCGLCDPTQICDSTSHCVNRVCLTACPPGTCGELSDNCGGTLQCGTTACTNGEACGLDSLCHCPPAVCPLGQNCSTFTNACGSTVECGTCTGDLKCGPNHQCFCPAPVCASGRSCGTVTNSCGATADCGTCPAGFECSGTTCVPQCQETCPNGQTCGTFLNNCGQTIPCGTCGPDRTCNGTTCDCNPVVCAPGQTCGTVTNDCSSATCGTCPTDQICVSNQCTCPTPACVIGENCGTVTNACGGKADCGTCPSGLRCVGTKCVSCEQTCPAGQTCGTFVNSCGQTIACGSCDPDHSCNGTTCVCNPVFCPPGQTCGTVTNSCGNQANCGTCTPPQTCGGGTPSVCLPLDPCNPTQPGSSTVACLQSRDNRPGGCYQCAVDMGCFDPAFGGAACENVSTSATACAGVAPFGSAVPSERDVCLATLDQMFSSHCADNGQEVACLCGQTDPSGCESGTETPTGSLYPLYSCDFGPRITNILNSFTIPSYGAGAANELIQCVQAFACDCKF